MILDHIDDPERFRTELRNWLTGVLPHRPEPDEGENYLDYEGRLQEWWLTQLRTENLATPHWPKEYGGVDLDLPLRAIMVEEFVRMEAPPATRYQISFGHLPATLLPWGSEEQKKKYLPEISERGEIWCQGFSEPGAGSDLANLRTRADRDGDHYVLNGQKIWSSFSLFARRAIVLARTDSKAAKHAGITFFLLDLKTPGVEVRPIRQANGSFKFGEVFMTDVRVPVEDRVGEEGMGWKIAQSTLASERGLFWFEATERLYYHLGHLLEQAVAADAAWLDDPSMCRRYADLRARGQGLRLILREMMFGETEDQAAALITTASLKVSFSVFRKDLGQFLVDCRGPDAYQIGDTSDDLRGGAMHVYLTSFSAMFGGGTNEIMRNIIAERGLGLPKG